MKSKKSKNSIILVANIVVVFVIAACVSKECFQLMLIQGDSMEPSYHNMQIVFVQKSFSNIIPGDVVAFECAKLDSVLVKRVVAGPGQCVVIKEGTLFVDGKSSPYYEQVFFSYSGELGEEVVLSDEEYIVIGDNVNSSIDSRYSEVGVVTLDSIIGRVV